MEKLKRLNRLQLKTILKGFFPGKYIRIKNNGRVIVKSNIFSFKKIIDSDIPEVLTSILPHYLSSCKTSESLGQHLKNISKFKSEKDIVNYLYSEYISLSHNITPEFVDQFQKNIRVTNFKRVFKPVTLNSIISQFFRSNAEKKEFKLLALKPSGEIHSFQQEILEKKHKLQVQYSHGKITVHSDHKNVELPKFDNTTIYDGRKEYVERMIV